MPELLINSTMTEAPNSGAVREERLPPKAPTGVRFAETMTTFFISGSLLLSFKDSVFAQSGRLHRAFRA